MIILYWYGAGVCICEDDAFLYGCQFPSESIWFVPNTDFESLYDFDDNLWRNLRMAIDVSHMRPLQ